MNPTWPLAAVAGALVLPSIASARPVVLETQLTSYGGDGAYVAIYLVDRTGKYHSTLWVAAPKVKYWSHLRDWSRATAGAVKVDGISGASVGAGKTLRVTVELADALLDAGYEIRIDTAVEKMKDNPSEVAVPLTRAGTDKVAVGRGYVKSFRYTL